MENEATADTDLPDPERPEEAPMGEAGRVESLPPIGDPWPGVTIKSTISFVYQFNFFRKGTEKGTAICRICEKENKNNKLKTQEVFKTKCGSTTGLRDHIFRHKSDDIQNKVKIAQELILKAKAEEERDAVKNSPGLKQVKLCVGDNNNLTYQSKLDPLMQERFDNGVLEFMADTYTTFKGLAKLVIIVDTIWPRHPKVKVYTDKTYARMLDSRVKNMFNDITAIIHSVQSETTAFNMTTDIWLSRTIDSFLSLTVHFITSDFKLHHFTTHVSYFENLKHSGVNIKNKIKSYLLKLHLDSNNISKFLILDNAAANKVAARLLNGVNEIWCILHTVALAVKDLLQITLDNGGKVEDILEKCTKLAKFSRKEKKQIALKEACAETGVHYKLPIIPNKTRWNSRCSNMESILHLKAALQQLRNDTDPDWEEMVLTNREFTIASHLCEVLQTVKYASKQWEHDSIPTINMVVVELYNIKEKLTKLSQTSDSYTKTFAKRLMENIEQRIPECGTKNKWYRLGHLIDPKYRGVILEEFGVYGVARDDLVRYCAKFDTTPALTDAPNSAVVTDTNQASHEETGAEKLLKRRRLSTSNTSGVTEIVSNVELEFKTFEGLNVGKDDAENILEFWKKHENLFPILTKFVREICCITASSATSERVFSTGTQVCTPKRCRLNPQTIENLIIYKQNYYKVKHFKENYNIKKSLERGMADYVAEPDVEVIEDQIDDIEDEFFDEDLEIEDEINSSFELESANVNVNFESD